MGEPARLWTPPEVWIPPRRHLEVVRELPPDLPDPRTVIGTPASRGSGQDATAGATSVSFNTNAAVTAGTHLVAVLASGATAVTLSSVSCGGLTWNIGPTVARGTSVAIGLAVAHAPAGLAITTAFTHTWSGSANRHMAQLYEVSGLATGNPIDAPSNGTANAAATTTPTVSGAGATTQADEIIIAAVTQGTTGAYTAGTGYTQLSAVTVQGTAQSLFGEYKIVAATGVQTAGFTTPSLQYAAALFALKMAAAAGAAPRRTLLGAGS